MKYKRENHKKPLKQKSRFLTIMLSFLIFSSMIWGVSMEAKALSQEGENTNSEVLELIMNSVIAPFKANTKRGHSNMLGYLSLNPLKVIKREVAYVEDEAIKEEFKQEQVVEEEKKAEEIVLNPFSLSENSISKQEQAKVEVVGNPQDNSKKRILIYHSHTTEAYDTDEPRKMDLGQTVAAVGDELAKEFEKQGFTVIHDKTIHDLDYNSAYAKSRDTMSKYFEKFKDFDFVVDLHRDDGPSKANVTTKINNEDAARLIIVTTTSDPRYKAHMSNINAIFEVAKREYPTLFREKNLHTNYSGTRYYNQDLSDNALLLEVGATSNKLQEAKNSMKYVARVVAEVINNRKK